MTERSEFSLQFTQGLHRAARLHPQRIATICGDRQRSYGELIDRVARLAAGLIAHGAVRDTCIAMLGLNSDRYLEYYLAVPWAGAIVNPVNFRWSPAEIQHALNDSQSEILFLDDGFAGLADALLAACAKLRVVVFCGDGRCPEGCVDVETLIAASAPVNDAGLGGEDVFGVFYTGGTTGLPKGVLLSHASVLISAMGLMLEGPFRGDAISLHAAPMFHLADLMNTAGQVLGGGTHVFLAAYRPDAVLALIQRHRLTDLLLVPAMLQALIDHSQFASTDVSSVRHLLYGASPAPEALIERALLAFPQVAFYQVYGMTEVAATISVLPPDQHLPSQRAKGRLRSAGRCFCHTLVRIADGTGGEAAPGTVGEILVRGPNVMRRYLNQEEATERAFDAGWLCTGDMGYVDEEGYVFIVDRAKDMIVSGGENVYSNEVENAIASHPAVSGCAVIGIPSEEWGEAVHAFVVVKPGCSITLQELAAHCRTRVAGYKCPRSVEVVASLPVSGAGKLLKNELRRPFWEGRTRNIN
ncbi:long-chain fatty acid--CoA ligase [Xanthomonas campestris pv. phormiicola]|nr:long-chain fatty acid--CoA ligase [Xanthomonas campestris pv. phormiicola]UYC15825.1 long-chain fatty acid--CoA ligase [Xanthomonas campestris pv. phormiicola]